MDGKIYRINEEVEEGNKLKNTEEGLIIKNGGGGKVIKLWRRKKKKLKREIKLKRERGK